MRAGRRPWTNLDDLHRESLHSLIPKYGLETLNAAEIEQLNTCWHRLDPWPDVVPGLTRLANRYTLGTLSNGNTSLLTDLAGYGALPFHVILGAETAHAYKPLPEAYLRNVAALGLEPGQVMLVAAHNGDLAAAHEQGLRTGFVARPTEYGPMQRTDLSPMGAWDIVCDDMSAVATALGCP